MSTRSQIQLSELINTANTGLDAIKRAPIVNINTGIKCLRIQDISQDKKFRDWGFCEVNEKNYLNFRLKENDIIIARTGETVGVNKIIKKDLNAVYNNGLIRLRVNTKIANPFFIYYSLQTKRFEVFIDRRARGISTQPNIRLESLLNYEICNLSLSNQRLIASLLSKYDELIENNEKRIKNLEEMAQRLYDEWFVKFNFPGHEEVKMIDTLLGKIPEGWEIKRLDEVIKVIRGTSYSTDEIDDHNGNFYLVNLKSFYRGGGFRFGGAKYFNGSIKENQLLKQGDIVVAVTDMTTDRAVISRPARIPNIKSKKITFSADVVKIIPDKVTVAFIYYSLLDYRFTETTKNKANGANVLHLKPNAISEYKIILPTKKLMEEFENLCINIVKLKDNLSEKNEKLTKIRALLIPQLVTGKKELKN